MMVYLYVLRDPLTRAARYVGATKAPLQRLRGHEKEPTSACRPWLESLRRQGMGPTMEILGTFHCKTNRARLLLEQTTIARMVQAGAPLLNEKMRRAPGPMINVCISFKWSDYLELKALYESEGCSVDGRKVSLSAFVKHIALEQLAKHEAMAKRERHVNESKRRTGFMMRRMPWSAPKRAGKRGGA
jgi:hypothetical protein